MYFSQGYGLGILSLLYLYTRAEQTSEYTDDESQVSHIREKSYKLGKGKAELKPLMLDWKHQYVLKFREKDFRKTRSWFPNISKRNKDSLEKGLI